MTYVGGIIHISPSLWFLVYNKLLLFINWGKWFGWANTFASRGLSLYPLWMALQNLGWFLYSTRGSHNVPGDSITVESSSTMVWRASSIVFYTAKDISCASRMQVSHLSTRHLLFQGLGSPSIVTAFNSSHLLWGRLFPSGSRCTSTLTQLISSSEVLTPSSFS